MKNLLHQLIELIKPQSLTVEVTVDVSDEDWGIFRKVRDGLKSLKGKGTLELDIIGLSRIHPSVVLALHDLLSRRPNSVKLRVNIRTNLADGAVVFTLLADDLYLRKGAWFQYASVQELEKKSKKSDEEGEEWKSGPRSMVNSVKESPVIKDYRDMTEIVGQYLPLGEFEGKRLPLEETLEEYGLLKDPARDDALARLFKA
jgi:hypothetical protein